MAPAEAAGGNTATGTTSSDTLPASPGSPTTASDSVKEPTSAPVATSTSSDLAPTARDSLEPLQLPVSSNYLRDAEFARLKAVLSQLRATLDTNARSVVQLRRIVRKLPREDRSQFDNAYAQVRVREVALRNSIIAASTASPEQAAAAQAQVAADYEAYARAVTVANATSRASREALANNIADGR